jgi:predicted MFS family arabinose efflux permease
LLAIVLMGLFANDVRAVFWVAVLPAVVAVAVLLIFVREPPHLTPAKRRFVDLHPRDLPRGYWSLVLVAGVFTLARFSEAFLILRGSSVGLSMAWAPLTLVVMSAAYMVSAYPAGWLADRMPRSRLLMIGCAVLVLANAALAMAGSAGLMLAGAFIWGLHMGLTEGVFAAMVADRAPADLRGTAFGVFNLIRGVLLLAASVLAGLLWDRLGPAAPFLAGAVLACGSFVLVGLLRDRH